MKSEAVEVHELHSPIAYKIVTLTTWGFTFGGFIPAVIKCLKTGYWWLNPAFQNPEWKRPHDSSMNHHIIISLIWLMVVILQVNVFVPFMIPRDVKSPVARLFTKWHKYIGYFGFALCWLFVANAHLLIYNHGVAGKLWMNGLASFVGSGSLYHLTHAILAIRQHDKIGHMWHIAGAMVWIAFPGLGRAIGLPFQMFVVEKDCDFLYTNGWLTPVVSAQILLLWLFRWSMLGTHWRFSDYKIYFVLIVVDALFAIADDSFLKCPSNPMMAQVPGKPFVLESSPNALY